MAREAGDRPECVDHRTSLEHTQTDLLLSELRLRDENVTDTIKLLDVVALTVDLPEHNLWHGQVGTVVEILADGEASEVEFCDRDGRTYESLGLRPDQLMVLRYEPLASPPEPAGAPV